MEIEFFYNSKIKPLDKDDYSLSEVLELLNKLQSLGVTTKIHDTAGWDSGKLSDVYQRAINPSMAKKFAIRRIFGSARESGFLFGKEVPAIIIQNEGKDIDVYPHKIGARRVTILDFLRKELSQRK